MIDIRCEEYDTVVSARRNLEEFLEEMDYTYKGHIKELPEWRSCDYQYYLELGLPNIQDFVKIIQGGFNEEDSYAPVRQIKRYLLINTHV